MNPRNTDSTISQQPFRSQTIPELVQNGALPDGSKLEAEDAALPYEPVPPRKTITLSVHYRVRGRGRPLPYSLDGEDGE